MKSLLTRFVKDESGATAIEYGLIAAGVATVIVAFTSTGFLNGLLNGVYDKIYTAAGVTKPTP
jgi:pilus assembly protein Flp/PilA